MTRELPTEEGSVIGWSFWWDGPNYQVAVLSYNRLWDETKEDIKYEGLMWHSTYWMPKRDPYDPMLPEELLSCFGVENWVYLGKINGRIT